MPLDPETAMPIPNPQSQIPNLPHPPRLRASAGIPSRFGFSAFPHSAFSSSALRRRFAPSTLVSRPSTGFTLIELIVVVVVIAILAAITLAAMGGVSKKAARDRTKAEIAAIANALEAYKSQNGTYPSPRGANNVPFELISGYLQAENIQVSGETLQDPFGGVYYYRYPGTINRVSFDVYSHAGEPATSSNSHIGNW